MSISRSSVQRLRISLGDRLVQRILLPMVFAFGLYGLVRYGFTGKGVRVQLKAAIENDRPPQSAVAF